MVHQRLAESEPGDDLGNNPAGGPAVDPEDSAAVADAVAAAAAVGAAGEILQRHCAPYHLAYSPGQRNLLVSPSSRNSKTMSPKGVHCRWKWSVQE